MPRKKQYSKSSVTEKAMQTFWQQGYPGTSMRTLEKKMGINAYSIYADFESKEGLFLASLERYYQLNQEVLLKNLMDSSGDLADIRHFFEGFVQSVKSGQSPNGCLFANTAMEFGATHAAVSQQLDAFFTLLHQTFFNLLQKAQAQGSLSPSADLHKYANYLLGCTEGLAVIAKVLDQASVQDFIDTAVAAFT